MSAAPLMPPMASAALGHSWPSPREPGKFAVALVQMAMGADPRENLEKGVDRLRAAARGGARVVCLPELFRTRYFCQREDDGLLRPRGADSGADHGRPLRGGAAMPASS